LTARQNSFEEYIGQMGTDGEWIDDIFIQMTSDYLQRRISILDVASNVQTDFCPRSTTENESLKIIYDRIGSHYASIKPKTIETFGNPTQVKLIPTTLLPVSGNIN